MVETVSQIAAREALKGKRERHLVKGELDSRSDAEGSCHASRRSTARRGRHRQRKKKKEGSDKDFTRARDQQDGAVADRIIYDLDFEKCKKMVVLPSKSCTSQLLSSNTVRRRSLGGCNPNNNKKQYRKPQPTVISDVIVKVEDMALEARKPDKRKMRQSKKSELIRQGQSGWAGACFDRSPSPSLLPMPPSVLLERACCQINAFNEDSFSARICPVKANPLE